MPTPARRRPTRGSARERWRDPEASTRLVRRGWDRVSLIYRPVPRGSDCFGHEAGDYRRWLEPVLARVPAGSPVLDLGCGCGIPSSALLATRFRVTGVDLSPVQVRRARRYLPGSEFVLSDMTKVRFPDRSFGAVVCLYSLIHVPLRRQRPLLRRVRRWLRPGGLFVVVTGAGRYEGVESDWLGSGAPMFWSHEAPEAYRGWLTELGLRIEHEEFIPEGEGGHQLFRASVPKGPKRARSGLV